MGEEAYEVDDPVWGMLREAGEAGGCGGWGGCGRGASAPEAAAAAEGGREQPPGGCPFCGSSSIARHDGNCMCLECHSLIERLLDYGAEWRFYGADDTRTSNPTRCFPPSNGLIQTLGTVVAAAPRRRASHWLNRTEAAAATQLSAASAGRTVHKYQVWSSMSYRDRVLCRVFDQLSVSAAQHGLPGCILEEAKGIYKRVSEARITRGENRTAVIAVCMYVACKKSGVPRSLKEIGEMFGVRSGAMTKATHTVQGVVADADATSSAPADFLGRFCSKLGLPEHATQLARDVVARADALGVVCDAMPPSIAGGAILLVADALALGVTKEAVAAVCVVAPVTVAKMRKRLAAAGLRDDPPA
jgi:transcription initiation factor TFIIB